MPLYLKPAGVIVADLGLQNGGPVHAYFTNRCYAHMDRLVPRSAGADGGSLRETVDIQPDKIIYEVPYALYQYYGIRADGSHIVRNYTTPNTGPFWDIRMWTYEGDDVIAEVQDYLNRGGN